MAAIFQLEQLRVRHLCGDGIDLAKGGVFVAHALDGKHQAADFRQVVLDVPVTKRWRQPAIVSVAKDALGLDEVVARQFLRQAGRFPGGPRQADASRGVWLDEFGATQSPPGQSDQVFK